MAAPILALLGAIAEPGGGRTHPALLVRHGALLGPDMMDRAGGNDDHGPGGNGDDPGLLEGRAESEVERAREHRRRTLVRVPVRGDLRSGRELDAKDVGARLLLRTEHPRSREPRRLRRAHPAQRVREDGRRRVAPGRPGRHQDAARDKQESYETPHQGLPHDRPPHQAVRHRLTRLRKSSSSQARQSSSSSPRAPRHSRSASSSASGTSSRSVASRR